MRVPFPVILYSLVKCLTLKRWSPGWISYTVNPCQGLCAVSLQYCGHSFPKDEAGLAWVPGPPQASLDLPKATEIQTHTPEHLWKKTDLEAKDICGLAHGQATLSEGLNTSESTGQHRGGSRFLFPNPSKISYRGPGIHTKGHTSLGIFYIFPNIFS